MSEKTKAEKLKKELFYDAPHVANVLSDEEISKADNFCGSYIDFMNECKTEREVVKYMKELAIKKGFVEFDKKVKYNPGDKVYYVNREKCIILSVIGKNPIEDGVHIAAAHIDSPRIDLKPDPLYEDNEIALFKTHYYGGIKKYQWTCIPLSLHGVIVKKDGSKVCINLGEKKGEPKFVITDLLPHLAQEQSKRKLNEGIKGEELNILVGSRPFKGDKESELVKLNIMHLLNEKYGIIEKDFLCAELELVPAFEAADIGFDRSMIGAYGHDDRVCSYTAAIAAFECENPDTTFISVLTDKEETGSEGNTGLHSSYLRYFIADLGRHHGIEARDILTNSKCLSADVNSAFDPTYPDVMEKQNSSYINRGVVVTKYTGARGKSGTSDASAEFMGEVRKIFDDKNVIWQTGELGKVDLGGGGTVAMFVANLNVDVVDVGVPVLSMHAPYEVVSKLDVYMAYRGFLEFFKA